MPYTAADYEVACICPMGVELAPIKAMLDEQHPAISFKQNVNSYILGEMSEHNVVITVLPGIGTNIAATVASRLLIDFPNIRFGLLVGIGGGVPDDEDEEDACNDIRLGDVVVSKPTDRFGGVVQYDLGKSLPNGQFEQTGVLNMPPFILRSAVENLRADHSIHGSQVPKLLAKMLLEFPAMQEEYSYPSTGDYLFRADYAHQAGRTCRNCDLKQTHEREDRKNTNPKFHYGTIGSANTVVKDAQERERLRKATKIICVEMEAAGLMNSFPCLVIRGICDYADSHKNKNWQPYAAATAAAYTKELLTVIPTRDVTQVSPALNVIQVSKYDRGLNLFDAPEVADYLFVGRKHELSEINAVFTSERKPKVRRVIALVGIGGIGKTQLAVAYAKIHSNTYTSIFWLDAASELSLQSSFRLLADRIATKGADDQSSNVGSEQAQKLVLNWLSEPENSRWLLIFDNYDDPDQYDLRRYFPYVSQGSILVTTRRLDRISGEQIRIRELQELSEGLQVLQLRSQRQMSLDDQDASRLVERLGGLPLALATAGAYLRKHFLTLTEYLSEYDARWNLDTNRPLLLPEYRDRTLYTTWDISYSHLVREDPDAAQMLKLLAYFDNKSLWYELFKGGTDGYKALPQWLLNVTKSSTSFGNVMRTLVEYCFLEVQSSDRSYSMHVGVHDWTLAGLNRVVDPQNYWYAFNCVARFTDGVERDAMGFVQFLRLVPHAMKLMHESFAETCSFVDADDVNASNARQVAAFFRRQHRLQAAATLLERLLVGQTTTLGKEHRMTLRTLNNLGTIYWALGKVDEAEKIYKMALVGRETLYGPKHPSTLKTILNLGGVYRAQHKLDLAEPLLERGFRGYEEVSGPSDHMTLNALKDLGILYREQHRYDLAESTLQKSVLRLGEEVGYENVSTLEGMKHLGLTYRNQGKLDEAQEIFEKLLGIRERLYGRESRWVCETLDYLGGVYRRQEKLDLAEQTYKRAVEGYDALLEAGRGSDFDVIQDRGIMVQKIQNLHIHRTEAITLPEHRRGVSNDSQSAAVADMRTPEEQNDLSMV